MSEEQWLNDLEAQRNALAKAEEDKAALMVSADTHVDVVQ